MSGTLRVILAGVLTSVLAFAVAFGLALGASRLRSVAGLAGLVAAAYAGTAADPRAAGLAIVLPSAVALLAADGVRIRWRRPAQARAAGHERRRAPDLLGERTG
jgi:hypothetical protein